MGTRYGYSGTPSVIFKGLVIGPVLLLLADATSKSLPTTVRAVGKTWVGMNPMGTRERGPDASRSTGWFVLRSNTATESEIALATNRRDPSVLNASAFGALPPTFCP